MIEIKDIVFDVGNVLIEVKHDAWQGFLQQNGAGQLSIQDFESGSGLIDYEHGRISTEQFFDNINRLIKQPVAHQELTDLWLGMFAPITEMLELANSLKQNYGVYLLSNTNILHWEHVVPTYQLDKICHAMLTSYDVGIMKPVTDIYQLAEQRFDLSAGHTMFIDDKLENIKAAQTFGWNTLHHQNITETTVKLKSMGLQN